jgi:hypothetical protein
MPEPFLEKILSGDGRCADPFEVIPRRAGRQAPLGHDRRPYLHPLYAEDHSFWVGWCRDRSNGNKSLTEALRRDEVEDSERRLRAHRDRLIAQYGEDPARACVFAGCDGRALVGKAVCWRHHG